MNWKPNRRVIATVLAIALMLVAGCAGPADTENATGGAAEPAGGNASAVDAGGGGVVDTGGDATGLIGASSPPASGAPTS